MVITVEGFNYYFSLEMFTTCLSIPTAFHVYRSGRKISIIIYIFEIIGNKCIRWSNEMFGRKNIFYEHKYEFSSQIFRHSFYYSYPNFCVQICSRAVLHDVPKVFDAISHGILPKYLNNYDILWKAYDWFRNIHCLWLLLQTRYTSQSDLNELYANVNVKVNELY